MSSVYERNKGIIDEFRANGGKVGGNFAGRPIILLHTIGAKSGKERINPVVCLIDDDRLAVIASKGGAPRHPDWYYNILAHPLITVEFGMETFQCNATVAAEPERSNLYKKMVATSPGFADYETKTTRIIPVIILTRVK